MIGDIDDAIADTLCLDRDKRPDPGFDSNACDHDTLRIPAEQSARGCLNDSYEIPSVEHKRSRVTLLVTVASLLSIAGLSRHIVYVKEFANYRPLMIAWSLTFAYSAAQFLLSWGDKAYTVTVQETSELDGLNVVVNVPLFNEDPETLDRCLYALVTQTRKPDRIEIVDDASTVDYSELRSYWNGFAGIVIWKTQQTNRGKKHVQAVTFTSNPHADIFVTIDSDTCLASNAIEEGLKPFTDYRIMSVAGIELAMNSSVNWLTRSVSARSIFFQQVICGAQSITGDILVNRGAYALYRAELIRRIVPVYLGERFLGKPVKLGDDAALTLFARGSGRAVQQNTAFAFTMYPEKISHHLRQFVRWMRGSTIRNCWRLRYLPILSQGWLFTFAGTYLFLASTAIPVIAVADWSQAKPFVTGALTAMMAWGYVTGLRTLSIRRSDESWTYRLGTVAIYPTAMLWGMTVLRLVRFYGIATYHRQGWTTRQSGAEVTMTDTRSLALTGAIQS
jgi:hyaluronan synthase